MEWRKRRIKEITSRIKKAIIRLNRSNLIRRRNIQRRLIKKNSTWLIQRLQWNRIKGYIKIDKNKNN